MLRHTSQGSQKWYNSSSISLAVKLCNHLKGYFLIKTRLGWCRINKSMWSNAFLYEPIFNTIYEKTDPFASYKI